MGANICQRTERIRETSYVPVLGEGKRPGEYVHGEMSYSRPPSDSQEIAQPLSKAHALSRVFFCIALCSLFCHFCVQ